MSRRHRTRSAQPPAPVVVPGVGPDAPVVANAAGGRQSFAPYRHDPLALALLDLARLLHDVAAKYADPHGDNWHRVSPLEHVNHALTHAYAWMAGDGQDDHLLHAFCRLGMAVQLQREREQTERALAAEAA